MLMVILVLLTAVSPATAADKYSAVEAKIASLSKTPGVRIIKLGKSAAGRHIYSIVITGKGSSRDIERRHKILLICGQHGDEQISTTSMLAFAKELTTDTPHQRKILGSAIIAIIPSANPDGFAKAVRTNANGVDLNRDWDERTQPETVCIWKFIKEYRPTVILDEHQWTEKSPRWRNWVEVSGVGSPRTIQLSRMLGVSAVQSMNHRGITIEFIGDRSSCDSRLAHRTFSAHGIPSMLIETSPASSYSERRRIYSEFASLLITHISSPQNKELTECLASTDRPLHSPITSLFSSPGNTGWLNWIPIIAALGSLTIMCAVNRGAHRQLNESGAGFDPSRHIKRLSVHDATQLELPTRTKLGLLKVYRSRTIGRKRHISVAANT